MNFAISCVLTYKDLAGIQYVVRVHVKLNIGDIKNDDTAIEFVGQVEVSHGIAFASSDSI